MVYTQSPIIFSHERKKDKNSDFLGFNKFQ